MKILGISAYYHDSAAALLVDGNIVAAAQEERFTRKKHDASFPHRAVAYCLAQGGSDVQSLDQVVFYDKPLLTFERLLETYLSNAPRGFRSFSAAMPVWLREKLYLKETIKRELADLDGCKIKNLPTLLFSEHHKSHAASAFFFSPFETATVLCLDGVGEWATTTAWQGDGASLTPLWEIDFPHSLGLLYSAFTYFTGFKVNSGEYKLMGLAPYGDPVFVDTIKDNLLDIKSDGSFKLNMEYFDYCTGLRMTNDRFSKLFGGPPRTGESDITQREMDIAASIQRVTEEIVLALSMSLYAETGDKNLCMAGGVALNCVANGKVLRESPFESLWIQPAAGDAGGSVGAAAVAWHEYNGGDRVVHKPDAMKGSFLGPEFSRDEILSQLDKYGAIYSEIGDGELYSEVAKLIAAESVVGWFQGRMEFGPRALGGRSILGDPRSAAMQSVMNLKIKYRESFRPFAPAVLAHRVSDYFDHDGDSPYMLLVGQVSGNMRIDSPIDHKSYTGLDRLKQVRSKLPAITHVDNSARIQTVHESTNPRFFRLLEAFDAATGCGVLVNTSFNVRGEPIVCTPDDAYRCFMRTEMDYLVIENFLLSKSDQPQWQGDESWMDEFELD